MSCKVIAITNQKGGVGKTTTSVNLSDALARLDKRVLLIDLDPQASASLSLGLDRYENKTINDVLMGECEIKDAICHPKHSKCDVVVSNINLSKLEIKTIDNPNREMLLSNAISSYRKKYDYIIMDCPPSLNMLTINALTAANSVLVPIQCEYYALEGLSQLIHTIELVKERLNKKLVMEGVVFTMYDARTNLSLQVVENVKDNLQQNIYKTIIPRNVRLAEAPSHGLPINLYDTRSAGAESYRMLAQEVLHKGEEEWQ